MGKSNDVDDLLYIPPFLRRETCEEESSQLTGSSISKASDQLQEDSGTSVSNPGTGRPSPAVKAIKAAKDVYTQSRASLVPHGKS